MKEKTKIVFLTLLLTLMSFSVLELYSATPIDAEENVRTELSNADDKKASSEKVILAMAITIVSSIVLLSFVEPLIPTDKIPYSISMFLLYTFQLFVVVGIFNLKLNILLILLLGLIGSLSISSTMLTDIKLLLKEKITLLLFKKEVLKDD